MKILSGSDLAGFIKQRQMQQANNLLNSGIKPKLAIIKTIDDEVINTYIRLKVAYGADIGVEVKEFFYSPEEIIQKIDDLNNDNTVHGIIVQLPLDKTLDQKAVLNAVAKNKDVDGLAENSLFDPATPNAILWLLAGYNIDLRGKTFVVVGQGALVGAPLSKMLINAGHKVLTVNKDTTDLKSIVSEADVLITGAGKPGLITSNMIPEGCVVIDAGVAVDSGKKQGDLADDVYQRDDLIITPKIGGVGPLTVASLFDNVLKAASSTASS